VYKSGNVLRDYQIEGVCLLLFLLLLLLMMLLLLLFVLL
jgi:hypothetical protein